MTREEAIKELTSYHHTTDEEVAHARADDILCEILTDLGYADVVEAYHKVPKWFA